MTKVQLRKYINNQITKINVQIDKLIIDGKDYSRLSSVHKKLVNQLATLEK